MTQCQNTLKKPGARGFKIIAYPTGKVKQKLIIFGASAVKNRFPYFLRVFPLHLVEKVIRYIMVQIWRVKGIIKKGGIRQ